MLNNKVVQLKREPTPILRMIVVFLGLPLFALVMLIILLFTSFASRSWPMPDAPEIGRTYVLIQDAVLTSRKLTVPETGWFRRAGVTRTVKRISTRRDFENEIETLKYLPGGDLPPNEGTVVKGSQLQVNQMFVYTHFNGSDEYARARLNDPERGEYMVYISWEDHGELPILRQVKK